MNIDTSPRFRFRLRTLLWLPVVAAPAIFFLARSGGYMAVGQQTIVLTFQVIDETGHPISNAIIRLFNPEMTNFALDRTRINAYTDRNGEARFTLTIDFDEVSDGWDRPRMSRNFMKYKVNCEWKGRANFEEYLPNLTRDRSYHQPGEPPPIVIRLTSKTPSP